MKKDKDEPRFQPYRTSRRLGDKFYRVPRLKPWQILPRIEIPRRKQGVSTIIFVWAFAAIILVGTLVLLSPLATNSGDWTHPVDALFTATSATCVTGLTVVDTANHWSTFGEIVILLLIQIGGFGIMTVATLLLMAGNRRIGLTQRVLIRESMGINRLGGVVRIVKQMAIFTITLEILGAGLIYLRLATLYPTGEAIWKSVFHSISAFNNAGFDLFGNFNSLIAFRHDAYFLMITFGLVFIGGISYLVIADVFRVRKWVRLSLDTKLILTTTISLLVFGTVVLFFNEMNNPATMGSLSLSQKILDAFSHSVSSRTAGFSTINVADFTTYSLFFLMFLMFIGGSPGSTAGGIKVTTFGLLAATVINALRGKERPGAFGREFQQRQIVRAFTLMILALTLVAVFVFILSIIEDFPFIGLLFETVSAFGTVGLSTGITPELSLTAKLMLSVLMFIGRLGPLALIITLIHRTQTTEFHYPKDMINMG